MVAWRGYSAEQLEWQYNPRLTVAEPQAHFERFVELSRQTRAKLPHQLDLRYGPGPLETLDVYPASAPTAPIHVFFHGGYWRGQDKRDYGFIARDLLARGVTVVVANYDLCPAVTVEEIVEEAARCLHFVCTQVPTGDPGRLSVSGHSAGAQLVAKLAGYDWTGRYGIDNPIRRAAAVSGVFELEPVRHTSLNEEIRLTEASARRNSPQYDPPPRLPLLLAVGAGESEEFRRQSRDYAVKCGPATEAALLELSGANHFSVLEALYLQDGAGFEKLWQFVLAPTMQ
jgi:arylformamidase